MVTSGGTGDVPIIVARDVQGQITGTHATTPDGVTHSLTVTKTISTNPTGYYFVITQSDFSEAISTNEQKYLTVIAVVSPDAGKWSFQASSGTSQLGSVGGFDLKNGQGIVTTSLGDKGTVNLTATSLSSLSASVPLTPNTNIQAALNKAAFFKAVLDQENIQN